MQKGLFCVRKKKSPLAVGLLGLLSVAVLFGGWPIFSLKHAMADSKSIVVENERISPLAPVSNTAFLFDPPLMPPPKPPPARISAGVSCTQPIETGRASWYGPRFHGKLTANADHFDRESFSAAHQTLSMGTLVQVVNQRNHRSVVVKINDRGGFHRSVIDLSEAAAREIGMIREGIGSVSLYACRKI